MLELFSSLGDCEYKENLINPEEIDYKKLCKESRIGSAKIGYFTLNPESMNLKFENINPILLSKKEWIGKQHGEVFAEVIALYGNTHCIPGVEYQKFLQENPDKIPKELRLNELNLYYTPASIIGNLNKNWFTFGGVFSHLTWHVGIFSVENDWQENEYVIIL